MTPEPVRAAPAPAPVPASAPAARAIPEPIAVPDLDFEPEPVRAAPPAPIEIPEEADVEPQLAPMHEFVPPAATTGHRPEPIAVAAPAHPPAVVQGGAGVVAGLATGADGGEAVLREALSRASREVIERVVWEVVPQLAETIIRENLDRLTRARQG